MAATKRARKKRAKRPKKRKASNKEPAPPNSALLSETGDGCFQKLYLEAVLDGMSAKDCAQLAGCHESTVREWNTMSEEFLAAGEENIFTEFYLAVRAAKAKRRHDHMNVANKAAKTDWKAALKLLAIEKNSEYKEVRELQLGGSVQTGAYSQDSDDQDA